MKKTLRDCIPHEFLGGEYHNTPAFAMLDETVIETFSPCPYQDEKLGHWPGKHKNVVTFWILGNGKMVGWNENPSRGWSFPVERYTGPEVDMSKIDNVVVSGIDTKDYPDFVDAYIDTAEIYHRELTYEELDWVNENESEFIQQEAYESLF